MATFLSAPLLSFPPSFSLLSLLPTIRSPFFYFGCPPCLPSLSPASSLSFTHSLFNLVSHLLVHFYLILNASIFIVFIFDVFLFIISFSYPCHTFLRHPEFPFQVLFHYQIKILICISRLFRIPCVFCVSFVCSLYPNLIIFPLFLLPSIPPSLPPILSRSRCS